MDTDRNSLAIDRTVLANQRTLMAYVRTSFYFIGLGLTVIGIESFQKLRFLALPMFVLSLIVIIIGFKSYYSQKKRIYRITHRDEGRVISKSDL